MKLLFIRYCLLFALSVSFSSLLNAESLLVKDIRIEGLQRISSSTVFSVLPIKPNTEISQLQLQDAVRQLFKTGFFSNIDIGRNNDELIITVSERPAISKIILVGNKVIDTDPLLDGLKSIGLAEGEIFNQSALEKITRELNAQYSSIGRYATQIDTRVVELDQNQVNVGIKITEGKVASIKHINIVGNKAFKERELQDLFSIKTTGTWSWITGNDKYAKQKLAGDLENLKSFYFNRGYLEFDVSSTQVSLSPNKETVFITVNIAEGDVYSISEVDLAGDPILPAEELAALIDIKVGDTFSQRTVLATSTVIKKRLGNEGYSFAKVNANPELDKENKTAKVIFFVDPGEISYVRRITFKGNTSTQDSVLRREMRQLEGAPISTENLERSKLRLQRLPIFSDVQMTTREVPGRSDQLDVEFTVVEQASGSVNASLGFSQSGGVSLGAGLQQDNWLGTGNTFGFQIDKNRSETGYSFNFSNPYFTPDGVSRGIRLFYRERDFEELTVSNFSSDNFGVNLTFGYPVSEKSRISFGFGFENTTITAGTTAVQEIIGSPRPRSDVNNVSVDDAYFQTTTALSELSDSNNNGFFDEDDNFNGDASDLGATPTLTPIGDRFEDASGGFLDRFGNSFDTFNFNLGWSQSTLNRGIFPTKGGSQNLNVEVTLPGGDLEYYKLIYRGQLYQTLSSNLTMRLKGRVGYADSYGDIDELPFFENFFSGGLGSVRGFEQSSLGPKGTPSVAYEAVPYNDNGEIEYAYATTGGANDPLRTFTDTDIEAIGGNILFEVGAELIFPVPFVKDSKSLRSLFFVDAGNVFSDNCSDGQLSCGDFDINKLSSSVGFGLQWLSPLAPLSITFSKALKKQPFDRTESFQFSLGQRF